MGLMGRVPERPSEIPGKVYALYLPGALHVSALQTIACWVNNVRSRRPCHRVERAAQRSKSWDCALIKKSKESVTDDMARVPSVQAYGT